MLGERIARAWLRAQGVEAEIVVLNGSVEIAPRLGQADLICDLVSSGATLAANQLKPVLDILNSEAVLAASPMGKIPYVDINGFKLAESGAIIGASIIVIAGLYVWHRETQAKG